MYEYLADVIKVVDGDTVRLDVDLGCDVWVRMTVRLYGIDAPELKHELGQKAKDYLTKLMPPGTPVRIITMKDKKEKYGRYLADIYMGEQRVTTLLIKEGLAAPYTGGKR